MREIISFDGWVKREPYRLRETAVEEEVGVILSSATGGAMLVNVVGVPSSSVRSSKGTSNEPPGESFDYGWKGLGFPCMHKDLVGLRKYTSRALLWQMDGVELGKVPINVFGCANTVPRGLPPEDVTMSARNRANGSDLLDCLVVKNVIQKIQIPGVSVR
jgi:hypothetical protein